MINNDAANGETRTCSSPKLSTRGGTLSVKHPDFSVQIVSEVFRGKVRVFQTAPRKPPVLHERPRRIPSNATGW